MARRESPAAGPGSRALIVDLIRSAGEISRTELMHAAGLTQPSISMIVRKLLDDGIVREVGFLPSTGGKPSNILTINAHAAVGIGLHITLDAITCVATDTRAGIIGRQEVFGVRDDDPGTVVERLADVIRDFVAALGLDPSAIVGVGVVLAGSIDQPHGSILSSHELPTWSGLELRADLHSRLGFPIVIDNDAAAAAVGEFWSRRVSRTDTFSTVYMSTGIGSGLVVDGGLFRGASSNAGELGHISIDLAGRECHCGNRGCLERHASPSAVVDAAQLEPRLRDRLALGTTPRSVARDFEELCRAAVRGDSDAFALIDESALQFAGAVVSLANLFDIDRLVLAGAGFAVAGSIYARSIRSALDRSAFARNAHRVVVELSSNPRDSAAAGAAALVLQYTMAPGHGGTLADR